jgi:hypothetical protein
MKDSLWFKAFVHPCTSSSIIAHLDEEYIFEDIRVIKHSRAAEVVGQPALVS